MKAFFATLACLVATTASGGVLVVDSANGPGADFTSLAAAIQAAAPGDVLLVRSGTYDGGFDTAGKSISIVADDRATVNVTNSTTGPGAAPALRIGTRTAGSMVVRGLRLSTLPGGATALQVTGTAVADGHLLIEECTIAASGGDGIRMENGSPAVVASCFVDGADGDATPGSDGEPISIGRPALVAGAGPLAVFGGLLDGGDGLDAGVYGPAQMPTPGQDGPPGILVENADGTPKVVASTICIGGVGGDGAAPGGNCLAPGNGGDGVLVSAGDNVHVVSLLGTGDLPGAPAPGCPQTGAQGSLINAELGAALPTWLPGFAPYTTISRVRREGETATITVSALSDYQTVLLVSLTRDFQFLPHYGGVLALQPTFVMSLSPPPVGDVTLTVKVPELGPGVEAAFAYIQSATRHTNGSWGFGEPSALLMLDAQF